MVEFTVPSLPDPSPLREQVYEVLERLIIDRVLPPGTHLGEVELAKQLGVSRSPVREALVTLQKDGWVEVRHRHGSFVRVPDSREIEETFEVREALETRAGMLAVEQITVEQLQLLEQVLEEGDAAIESGEVSLLVDTNARFHQLVVEAAGNRVLKEMMERLDKRSRWFFAAVAAGRAAESWKEHAQIAESLRAGDAKAIAELIATHVNNSRNAYRQQA